MKFHAFKWWCDSIIDIEPPGLFFKEAVSKIVNGLIELAAFFLLPVIMIWRIIYFGYGAIRNKWLFTKRFTAEKRANVAKRKAWAKYITTDEDNQDQGE